MTLQSTNRLVTASDGLAHPLTVLKLDSVYNLVVDTFSEMSHIIPAPAHEERLRNRSNWGKFVTTFELHQTLRRRTYNN